MHLIIIAITLIVSLLCFNNRRLADRLQLRPYVMVRERQWDRIITHGFVHGDMGHLLVNMFVLWSFGDFVSKVFNAEYLSGGMNDRLNFCLLYFGGLIAASLYDVIKRRNDPNFASIGASGAVSAVVFATIFYNPTGMIYLFMAIPIPGIVFGLIYLGYESYAARRSRDRINHHAHIFGAVFGFIYPVLTGGFGQVRDFFAHFNFF